MPDNQNLFVIWRSTCNKYKKKYYELKKNWNTNVAAKGLKKRKRKRKTSNEYFSKIKIENSKIFPSFLKN